MDITDKLWKLKQLTDWHLPVFHFVDARKVWSQMIEVRFLLTDKCTAKCSYCHNEGQQKNNNFLPIEKINLFLESKINSGKIIDKITLSGGEPTLHPQLTEIVQLCKKHCSSVSLATHGGHPELLKGAIQYLDKIKMHMDSLDIVTHYKMMGISLKQCLSSIELARSAKTDLVFNHVFTNLKNTVQFIYTANDMAIDCKIIELFKDDSNNNFLPLELLDLNSMNYYTRDGTYYVNNKGHKIYLKRCGEKYNKSESYFVGSNGIRYFLDGELLSESLEKVLAK